MGLPKGQLKIEETQGISLLRYYWIPWLIKFCSQQCDSRYHGDLRAIGHTRRNSYVRSSAAHFWNRVFRVSFHWPANTEVQRKQLTWRYPPPSPAALGTGCIVSCNLGPWRLGDVGADGAQKSLQVETSLLATMGELWKQTDGLREHSAPRFVFLEFRFLKNKSRWHVSKEALLYFANTGVCFHEHAVYIYSK